MLQNVTVDIDLDEDWKEEIIMAATSLPYDQPGFAWVCVARPEDEYATGKKDLSKKKKK